MLSKLGLHRLGFTPSSQLPCSVVVIVVVFYWVCACCVYVFFPPHFLKIAAQSPWFEMLIKMGRASGYNLCLFLHAKRYAK